MGYLFLALSISCSSFIVSIFKEIKKYQLDLLQVIAYNYLVCVLVGLFFSPNVLQTLSEGQTEVVPLALLQGGLFISMFFLIGTVTQVVGLGYAALITRMSMVLPIVFSFFYYQELVHPFTWVGILLAFVAVVLINKGKLKVETDVKHYRLAILVLAPITFLGSGLIDCIFAIFTNEYSAAIPNPDDFQILLFGVAGILGLIAVLVRIMMGKTRFNKWNVVGGIVLGVPNYFSIYFLVHALEYFTGTFFFPANSIGIVIVASLIGIVAYREKYLPANYLGILVAVGAILMMMLGEMK